MRKLYGFLFSTFLIVAAILFSATLWSLFAKDFRIGESDMELSRLLTPIPVENNEPPSEPEKPKQQNEPQPAKSDLPNRKFNMAQVEESQYAPDKVSTAPNTVKARPNKPFTVNPKAAETDGTFSTDIGRGNSGDGKTGFKNPGDQSTAEIKNAELPKPPPAFKPEEIKKPSNISLGVINGKASSLPIPAYPPAARAVNASGAVNVQVTIDEQGNVISAKAVSGHPLLRDAAERAARGAKFTPTLLSKSPVKVNGLIVYNFTR